MTNTTTSKTPLAVVTGGSRGLGRGVVQALAARGVHVVALARDPVGLENAEVKAFDRLHIVPGWKSSCSGAEYNSCTRRARYFGASSSSSMKAR